MIINDLRAAIDYLKSQAPIDKVMGDEIHLTRAGSDLLKAVCCFHEEKTPSLTVTPSKGLYHCFGCKASGDIVTFYQKYHGMSLTEAVHKISEKYNINIDQFKRPLTADELEEQKLFGINKRIADGMHEYMMGTENNRGLHYMLGERDVDIEILEEFQIGYSPDLSKMYALAQGAAGADLERLDLDRDTMWTDAIVYPLHNPYGRITGFKTRPYWDGQTMDQKGHKYPKFLGTSTRSPLHDDGQLYGFHVARKHMVDGRIIGVEGQHDVLASHQIGIKNTVGTEGVALNDARVKVLEDHGVREIVVVYDGDNAGREASLRLAKQVAELNTTVTIKIALLPDGQDPDTFIKEKGKLSYLQTIHEAVYASQFLIDMVADEMPIHNVTGKIDFIKKVQPVILSAPSFEQTFLMAYVAEKIRVEQTVIEDMMREEQAKGSKSLLYNIEGEQIVLGEMLRNEDFRIATLLDMQKSDWYLPRHQLVFEIITDMEEQQIPVSPETVKVMMNNKGYKQVLNDGAVLDEIWARVGNHGAIKEDLIDKSIRRQLIREADNLKRSAQDLSSKVVITMESHMDAIQKATDNDESEGLLTAQDGATNMMATLMDRMQNPNQIVGIPLNDDFKSLNNLINGIQKKKLITIAANQSVGKTTLVCNWLNHLGITLKRKWAHFTLEMPSEEMVVKLVGIRSGVSTQKIERGNLDQDEFAAVQRAALEYHEGGLTIIDDQTTMEGIMNMTRKLIRSEGIEGISIDYIQLMHIERARNKQRYEELGDISGGLKNDVAKKLDIPVVILSQLGRSAIDSQVATAEHGSGSYKIAQDSDIYITLKEKSDDEIEQYGIESGNLVMNLDKNRGGRGHVLLDVLFQKDIQRMMEIN